MQRVLRSFPFSDLKALKKALLNWSRPYQHIVWLDSNEHHEPYSSFEAVLAVGGQTNQSKNFIKTIDEVQNYLDKTKDWLFGCITYDFKNQLEALKSRNRDALDFPEVCFFQPEKIIRIKDNSVDFLYLESVANEIENDFNKISNSTSNQTDTSTRGVRIQMRIHKDAYFEKVNSLLDSIKRGDIYEANLCQEFYSNNTGMDPWHIYRKLNDISEPPFATFLRLNDKYLLCASPERYLKKMGNQVISQPIKGTAPRGLNVDEDLILEEALANDPKERAENIMITDLVRNDLSKSALMGSVDVKELCKVYRFKQVHQMISTIESEVSVNTKATDLIKDTFPMGSMTGAPKISAMQIIEELEETKRGLYSGTVGYFDPKGDFDFNVVIRSILYNASKQYISYSVGSAITAKSDPAKEYQECLLKAKAMRSVLESTDS
ncbi:anthranilate synthase component I family protein [Flagellimonas allohymeniacidonis]|uniref:Anthranilate synthase component I family protein n=1 Tax=Flagellimonas allohymeniacidonis TaxID=2517819 RepID=A0A4Q8QGU7_9FLAO|nr:anthranilate synthase component I family protein [Allomuricauda hymeniacidonis]TAI48967.1 anthranilate synthase component I family protein [Allomuricauda hymeniacidonis]